MSPADSPFAPLPAPGPHPATEELRAYAAGTLAPAEQHRIEAHMLDCERCADLVEGFSMSDEATTDQAVADLRSRLQARVGTSVPEPLPVPSRWPRVAAAAVLLGAVAGGIWTRELHETAAPPATARLEATAPAAPVEAPSSVGPTPTSTTPTAATETPVANAPAAAKPADYAAVIAPSRSTARQTARRAAPRVARPSRTAADAQVLADAEMVEASGAAATVALASNQPASKSAATASQMESESADKSEVAVMEDKAATADSVGTVNGYSNAGPAKKAKSFSAAAPTNGTTARVLATPLPGGIAIKPAPMGGTSALRDYLRREAMEFEPENNAQRLTGTVRLKFVVGADGKVSDLKVTRGLREDYDNEAIRMVCEGPAWQPGVAGGRRAPLPMELNIAF